MGVMYLISVSNISMRESCQKIAYIKNLASNGKQIITGIKNQKTRFLQGAAKSLKGSEWQK